MRDVINEDVVFVCAAAVCVSALQVGGVCVCVCVPVQWRVATRIQSNTNSLHAPGFLGRLCVVVRVPSSL